MLEQTAKKIEYENSEDSVDKTIQIHEKTIQINENKETLSSLYDMQQQKEISIYRKHGAVNGLAESMAKLFGAIASHPIYSLEERKENAGRIKAHHLYQHLSFDMLLLGETEQAKEYMQDAVNTSAGLLWPYMMSILDNINKVQEIITSSKDELNNAREKYNLPPLEHYLR